MVGASFTLLLISQPLHQLVSANLGGRMAAHLYDRLISVCVAPAGIAHLERSELTTDLTMARDFDLGMMGPPLDISMDFIAGGLVDLVVGISAAILLFDFHWWAALSARRRLVVDPLVAARERRVEGPQHRRGTQGAAPRRVLVPAGRRRRAGQGAALLRSGRMGDRSIRHHSPPPLRPAVRGDPAAREVGPVVPGRSCSAPTWSCSGCSPTAPPTRRCRRLVWSCSSKPRSASRRSRSVA